MSKRLPHEWDEEGCCIHCNFDGAEDWWLNSRLRLEIGDDEYKAREKYGEFDAGKYCPKRTITKS